MALLSSKEKKYTANLSEAENVVGEGCYFEGSIETDKTVKIDGYYLGQSLRANVIIIGKTGKVKSNIFANNLILEGILLGDVIANVRVVLQPDCKLIGNISTGEIITTKGVEFEGMCRVTSDLNSDIKQSVREIFKELPSQNSQKKVEKS